MLLQLANFSIQSSLAFCEVRVRVLCSEIRFIDDGKHGHLEQDSVQPWSLDDDFQLIAVAADIDVALLQVEKPKKFDEIRLDEAQTAEIGKLFFAKTQQAKVCNMTANFFGVRTQVDIFIAAFETIFDPRSGKLMQNRLHHREFI